MRSKRPVKGQIFQLGKINDSSSSKTRVPGKLRTITALSLAIEGMVAKHRERRSMQEH